MFILINKKMLLFTLKCDRIISTRTVAATKVLVVKYQGILNEDLFWISRTGEIVATEDMEVNDPGVRRPNTLKQELLIIATA